MRESRDCSSLWRTRWTYRLLRVALFCVCLAVAAYIYLAWHAAFAILHNGIEIDGAKQDSATILLLWWHVVLARAGGGALRRVVHVMLRSRSVYAAFTGRTGRRRWAATACWRTCAPTGAIRAIAAAFMPVSLTHIVVLVVIPWILSLGGCVEAYRVPKGSGNPVVAMVKMVKPKKKKKKTLSLRPNSAIVFDIPDLDDTEVDQDDGEADPGDLSGVGQRQGRQDGQGRRHQGRMARGNGKLQDPLHPPRTLAEPAGTTA